MESANMCIVAVFTAVFLSRVRCFIYNRTNQPTPGIPFLIEDGQTLHVLIVANRSTEDGAGVDWSDVKTNEPNQMWMRTEDRFVVSYMDRRALCAVPIHPRPAKGFTHELKVFWTPRGCHRWSFGWHEVYCDDWTSRFWFRRHTHYALVPFTGAASSSTETSDATNDE